MSLNAGARVILKQSLAAKKEDKIVIVTDDEKKKIGEALYEEAKKISSDSIIVKIITQKISGSEPPVPAAAAMEAGDIVICPTLSSLTHTNARLKASENGARVVTMPGITERMFSEGPIKANYEEVAELTRKITRLLDKAKTATIITKDNNKLELSIVDRQGVPSTGIYQEEGESGNLPTGEAYIAPIENSAEGSIYIDGSIADVGALNNPLIISVSGGKISNFEGKEADLVEDAFPEEDESRTIGELGIGTNPKAEVTGVVLEDEKIYGSVHIAFGTNKTFGGALEAKSHIDCVTLKPTLYLDDEIIIEEGEFKI